MNRISEITKRDILDLFRSGIDIDDFLDKKRVTYLYFGRLEEIEFIKRLYDLKSMQSFDSRFPDAEGDIWQHTENNDDYLRRIFREYLDGKGYASIAQGIQADGIKTVAGKTKWWDSTIRGILENEKYYGECRDNPILCA